MMRMIFDTPEERRKFVVLYEKYRYLMLKVAYDVLGDRFLAEDVVHNAFIKVSKRMGQVDSTDSAKTKRYLIVIAKNEAIDVWRKRKIRMDNESYIEDVKEAEMPLEEMVSELDNDVLNVFQKLPEIYRDVFLLKYSSGFDNDTIADILGISEATVRKRISRGKSLIQNEFRKMEESHGAD